MPQVTTSAQDIIKSEVEAGEVISAHTRAYFQSRLRNRLYTLVISSFRAAEGKGLTRAKLARRMGKRPEIVTRLLSAPGNWTLDTVSDLLLSCSGEELDVTSSSPFSCAPRNYDAYLQGAEMLRNLNAPRLNEPSASNEKVMLKQVAHLPPLQGIQQGLSDGNR